MTAHALATHLHAIAPKTLDDRMMIFLLINHFIYDSCVSTRSCSRTIKRREKWRVIFPRCLTMQRTVRFALGNAGHSFSGFNPFSLCAATDSSLWTARLYLQNSDGRWWWLCLFFEGLPAFFLLLLLYIIATTRGGIRRMAHTSYTVSH